MPGIIVGIDGSDHSRHALEWAVKEAAVRQAPLTVLTVNQTLASYWAGAVAYPEDRDRTELAREAAQEETDRVIEKASAAGGFKRLVMGSVSTTVTHRARCPVVVIPSDNS